jgi:hypothetical protein
MGSAATELNNQPFKSQASWGGHMMGMATMDLAPQRVWPRRVQPRQMRQEVPA